MPRNLPVIAAVIGITTLLAAACGQTGGPAPAQQADTGWQEKWDRTLAAAKQEGSVRMYIIMTAPVREEIAKAFKARYGIEIEYVSAPPPKSPSGSSGNETPGKAWPTSSMPAGPLS